MARFFEMEDYEDKPKRRTEMKCPNCEKLKRAINSVCDPCIKEQKPKQKYQSQHKAGEPLNDEYEYSGIMRIPNLNEPYTLLGRVVINNNPTAINLSDNDGYREILRPRKKKPVTTVTSWRLSRKGNVVKDSYTFNGLPDIDRVIRETLDVGALAIKIECTKTLDRRRLGLGVFNGLYIWSKNIGEINHCSCEHVWCPTYYTWSYTNRCLTITNADIESAIREYAKTQIIKHTCTDCEYCIRWGDYKGIKIDNSLHCLNENIEISLPDGFRSAATHNHDCKCRYYKPKQSEKTPEPVNITDFATMADLTGITSRLDALEKELYAHGSAINRLRKFGS